MLTITQQTHQGSYTNLRISQVENCAFLTYQYMRGMTTYLHLSTSIFQKKVCLPICLFTLGNFVIGYYISRFRYIQHQDSVQVNSHGQSTWIISNPCLLLCQSSFCQHLRITRTVCTFQLFLHLVRETYWGKERGLFPFKYVHYFKIIHELPVMNVFVT